MLQPVWFGDRPSIARPSWLPGQHLSMESLHAASRTRFNDRTPVARSISLVVGLDKVAELTRPCTCVSVKSALYIGACSL